MTTEQNQEPKGKLNLHRGHPYKDSGGRFRTAILTDDNETYAVAYADENEGSSYRAQQIIDSLNSQKQGCELSKRKAENEALKAKAQWVDRWFPVINRDVEKYSSYHISAVQLAFSELRALINQHPEPEAGKKE